MTLLTDRGEGPGLQYAGQPMHILAGHDGRPAGFAVMEITIPPLGRLSLTGEPLAAGEDRKPTHPGHLVMEVYPDRMALHHMQRLQLFNGQQLGETDHA